LFDPKMELLTTQLAAAADALASDPASAEPWARARAALAATGADEPELARVLEARDPSALAALVEGWRSGKTLLPKGDREVLSRALKAFRKSLKVTRLDAESSLGGGPFSGGRESGIRGVRPPERYPRAVWQELVRQGRLLDAKQGIYELPPE
jgi:hypothetical protein